MSMPPRDYHDERRDPPPPSTHHDDLSLEKHRRGSDKIYQRSVTQLKHKKAKRLKQLEELTSTLRHLEVTTDLSSVASPLSTDSALMSSNEAVRRLTTTTLPKDRRSKEARFLLLTKKAEEYSRRRQDDWSVRTPNSPASSNRARTNGGYQYEDETQPTSFLESLYSLIQGSPSEEEVDRRDEDDVVAQRQAKQDLMRLKRELIRRKLRARRTAKLAAAERAVDAAARAQASETQSVASSIATSVSSKIAKALKRKRRKKKVRFCQPLVTDVHTRPYTKPEDIEKLFFIEEELDELEWDRAHVDGDQFEVVVEDEATLESESVVSVTYKNKRTVQNQARELDSPGPWVSFSPSDLSAIYE